MSRCLSVWMGIVKLLQIASHVVLSDSHEAAHMTYAPMQKTMQPIFNFFFNLKFGGAI